MDPSIFILSDVRMTANRVAVNVTVPSGFNGMFMATNLCNIAYNVTRGYGGGMEKGRNRGVYSG